MPGVTRDSLKIEALQNHISISGERRQTRQKFQRTFTLPVGVNLDRVEAKYEDGILRVELPKPETAKPRQIRVAYSANSAA